MFYLRRVLAVSAITLSCYSSAGWTQTSSNSITLSDAIRATLKSNPQLAGYTFRADALKGEATTAALKPEWRAHAELENVAGSGELRGADAAELTLALSSVIELGGQRDARLGLVSARQQQLQSTQRVLTLDILADVTRTFIELAAAQEQLALLQDAHLLAERTFNSIARLAEAGGAPEAERLRAKAAVVRARIDMENGRQKVKVQQINLSAYWGDATPDFSRVQADLFSLPPTKALSELHSDLANNPDIAALSDEVRLREAELAQAKSERGSSLEWSAGVRRLQETKDSALVVGISMPLSAGRRASGAIATATANQAGAEFERDSAQRLLEAKLAAVYEVHQRSVAQVQELRTDVLPSLKQAMKSTSDAFTMGRYSYIELALAQRELLETQMAVIDAAVQAQTSRIDIERITGSALTEQTLEVTP
ncbi:MAG: TolC family protein [Gammaproteobacteria bacterium]|nr:MAG: TolC family protein [Gammaproteobacteria bacterium]